jgi:hypothetical protein
VDNHRVPALFSGPKSGGERGDHGKNRTRLVGLIANGAANFSKIGTKAVVLRSGDNIAVDVTNEAIQSNLMWR